MPLAGYFYPAHFTATGDHKCSDPGIDPEGLDQWIPLPRRSIDRKKID